MMITQNEWLRKIICLTVMVLMIAAMPLSVFADDEGVPGESDDPDRIVATLTIASYPGSSTRWMPHGFMQLTAKEDLDVACSFVQYYKPDRRYMDLLEDYYKNPDKYNSSPVLYNNNELGLEDRESYFDITEKDAYSEPETISVKAGENINISASSGIPFSVDLLIAMLEDSSCASSREVKVLIKQLRYYSEGSCKFNPRKLTRSVIKTFFKAYREALNTGHNPIDGRFLDGGIKINREIHDQFVGKISRLPNNYYTVDITATELAEMEKYISDPANNFFSFLDRNCTYTATHIWNAALFDRPELHFKANLTGFSVEPESLYLELGILRRKKCLDGHGGRNFTPRPLEPWVVVPEEGSVGISSKDAASKDASSGSEGASSGSQAADKADDATDDPKITLAVNTLKVAPNKTLSVKFKTLRKKNVKLSAGKIMTVKSAKGKVTYRLVSVNKNKNKFSINNGGALIIKKGTRKGMYKVKIRVRAVGNSSYMPAEKTVTVKIRVK